MRIRAFLALLSLAGSVSAQELFQFNDAGQPRAFELALDQIAISTPTARRVISTAPAAATAAELKANARSLARTSGQEVELVLHEIVRGKRHGAARIVTSDVLIEAADGTTAAALAYKRGAVSVRDAGNGFWVATAAGSAEALDLAAALQGQPDIASAEPLLARQQTKKLVPNDPFFTNQWHLRNTGQFSGIAGTDIRVTNVWDTYRGTGQYIAIIDDGLQTAHPDLSANVNTTIDYDINYSDGDPSPDIAGDDHGTACAGVAAARGNNSVGVSGSAPEATLVGLRLISAASTDADEANALNWSNSIIQIKSNSWGPSDDGATLEGPGTLAAAALSNACAVSRGGRGALIFWAGGNGGENDVDDSNFDGYANSIYSIAIAAVCNSATSSWYSESGANIVVAAPSSGDNTAGSEIGIWTVDRTGADGYNTGSTSGEPTDANYTATFGGTSSATPLAAGVGALVLQANTNLGWRDVQEILIRSATRVNPTDSDWRTNAAGYAFNHKYGGGLINASGAVAMATTWTNLGAQTSTSTNQSGLSVAIPDNNAAGITRTFTVTDGLRIEHAVVTLSATHTYRGDLKVELIAPGGMTSVVGAVRGADSGNNYSSWKFMSVRHWGEQVAGTWTVRVADRGTGDTGTLTALGLTFYGTAGAGLSNQPPVLAAIGSKSVVHSNTLTFAVTASDTVDGDAVSLVASNLPAGATFGVTNGNGTFTWTNAGPLGVTNVTFHAFDVDGFDSETVAITVNDGSCVPSNIVTEGFDASTSLPAGWTGSGSANDTLATHLQSSPNCRAMGSGDTVITPAVSYPTQITFYVDSSAGGAGLSGTIEYAVDGGAYASLGSFIVSETGSTKTYPLDSSPDLSDSANVTFRFASTFNTWYLDDVVIDGGCGAGGGPAQVSPVLAAIGAKSVTVSNLLAFAVTATDANSDPITLVASNLPAGATFGVTNGNGTFTWTSASPTGNYTVTFHAFDDDGFDNEAIAITVNPGAVIDTNCTMIISEYVEGSSNNKAVEIYNPSASAVDLLAGNYVIQVYANGGTTPNSTIALTGTVAAGGAYVLVNSSAGAALKTYANQQSASLTHNGNDPLVLRSGGAAGTVIDRIGQVGNSANYAVDATTRRKSTITRGDTNLTAAFTLATEWDSLAIDTFTDLGTHTNDCGSGGGPVDLDTDDDSIDDAWELATFTNLTTAGYSTDYDGDGFLDRNESLAGSNAHNGDSALEATGASAPATGVLVQWQSESNKQYVLWRSTNLLEGFVRMASNIPASYPINTYTDAPPTNAMRAYRIELQ